jgi:AAA domain
MLSMEVSAVQVQRSGQHPDGDEEVIVAYVYFMRQESVTMAFESERTRGKRAYRPEERLHSWGRERIEHPTPQLIDLHPEIEKIRMYMEEAIREALEDANSPRTRYKARNGKLRSARGESYRYDFLLEKLWETKDDTPVKIQIDPHDPKRVIDGTVVETDGTVISLATETPLPEQALQLITLYEDTSWLLQKLLNAVAALQETPSQMGAKTFGVVACIDGEQGKGKLLKKIGSFAPDDDQRKALWRGLYCDTLRLIGPPGSGKTKTLAALAWYYLQQGMKVLLLAHTNEAVDNAVTSLQELCRDTRHADWLSKHRIVRIGNAKDLDTDAYRDVLHGAIVDQELGELAIARDALKQEDGQISEERAGLEQVLVHKKKAWKSQRRPIVRRLEDAEATLGEVNARIEEIRSNIKQEIKAKQEERANAQRALAPLEISETQSTKQYKEVKGLQQERGRELASIQQEVANVEGMNRLQRFFYIRQRTFSLEEVTRRSQVPGFVAQGKYNLEEEKTYARRLREFIVGSGQTLQGLKKELDEIHFKKIEPQVIIERANEREAELRKILVEHPNSYYRSQRAQREQERDRIAAELSRGELEISTIQRRIEQIRDRRNEIRERLEEIERESRLVKEQVAANADLIAATLTGVYTSPYLSGRYFDCVIIDEASMAALPVILIAAARATQHVNIIGDPLQLAPITGLNEERKYPKAREWLGTDLFSYLGISLEQAERGEKQTVFLSQQSRMDPDISLPVSTYIYQGRLKNRE